VLEIEKRAEPPGLGLGEVFEVREAQRIADRVEQTIKAEELGDPLPLSWLRGCRGSGPDFTRSLPAPGSSSRGPHRRSRRSSTMTCGGARAKPPMARGATTAFSPAPRGPLRGRHPAAEHHAGDGRGLAGLAGRHTRLPAQHLGQERHRGPATDRRCPTAAARYRQPVRRAQGWGGSRGPQQAAQRHRGGNRGVSRRVPG